MNDNTPLLDQAYSAPAFVTAADSYHLYSETLGDFTLLDDAAARDWQMRHRWEREQFEASFSKPKVRVRDKPMIEFVNYIPEHGEGSGYITTASLQPHHRETADTELADIFYFDGALTGADNWRLPDKALRHRPIILCRPGEHLLGARTAVELALYGERCCWIDVGNDIIEWEKRLSRFELILPKRFYQ